MNKHEVKFLNRMLRTRKAEALEWLRAQTDKSTRVLGELGHKEAIALVRRFYEAGALQVLAVDIHDWARGQSCNDLIVELPSDEQSRQRLFKLQAEVVLPQGFEGDVDKRQKHLFVGVK
jgi:hypothetical protein